MGGVTQEIIMLFQRYGSYCRTGAGYTFALEAFARTKETLQPFVDKVGGNIYPPPPAAPTRWTWRLYGDKAEKMYAELREHLSVDKRERGDNKLTECTNRKNLHELGKKK